MMGKQNAATLARELLSRMSETSEVSDALYRTIVTASAPLPYVAPEPSFELMAALSASLSDDELAHLIDKVENAETLDMLARKRASKVVWCAVSANPHLSLRTAEYLARRSSRKSASDRETFNNLALHPQMSVSTLIGYMRENRWMVNNASQFQLGRNAAARPDQRLVLLHAGPDDEIDLSLAKAQMLADLDSHAERLELLERLSERERSKVAASLIKKSLLRERCEKIDTGVVRLMLLSDDSVDLSSWLEKPVSPSALKLAVASDSRVTNRLLLASSAVPQDVRERVLARMEECYAEGSGQTDAFRLPRMVDLLEATVKRLLPAALEVRSLKLLETVDHDMWRQAFRMFDEADRIRDMVDGGGEFRELLDYVAEAVSSGRVQSRDGAIDELTRLDHLPQQLMLDLLRRSCWDMTLQWFERAGVRQDPERIWMLSQLLTEPGTAFSPEGNRTRLLDTEWVKANRIPSLLEDEEILEWAMNSCAGLMQSFWTLRGDIVPGWFASACTAAGIVPEKGYEVLLSLLPDWEGTAVELVDTVAAVSSS